MTSTITHGAGAMELSKKIEGTLSAAYARGTVEGDGGKMLPTFPSGMSKEPGAALARLVKEERATTTLETGMALGLSTLWMLGAACAVAAENGAGTLPKHTAIDPYQKTDWKSAGLRLVEAAGATELVTHVAEDSTLALPRLVAEGAAFDLVFVDGGHLYELAFCDILFGLRLVRPGGLVVVDDVWMPSVTTAVNYFTSNGLLARETRPRAADAPELDATKRFALLRVPTVPVQRNWDHFAAFEVAQGRVSNK